MVEEEVRSVGAEDQIRANTYSVLGALLTAPPSAQLLELLRGIDRADSTDGGLATAWETLRLAGERSQVEAVDEEYHELFIGVGRGEVLPYGSWYLTGFLMDMPLVSLRQALDELGIERREGVSEPEDHAGALCETMGLLISDGSFPFETQRKFFYDYIEPWMRRFFKDLQQSKSARFYRAVGQLGDEFLAFEKRYLEMLV